MASQIPHPKTRAERQKMRQVLATERKDSCLRNTNIYRRGLEAIQFPCSVPEPPFATWSRVVLDPWTYSKTLLIKATPTLYGLPEELISNIMLQSRDIPTMSALAKTNRHFYGIFHTHIDHIATELYASTSKLEKSLATLQVLRSLADRDISLGSNPNAPRHVWVLQQMLLNERIASTAANMFRGDMANHPRAKENAFWTDLLFPRVFYLLWLIILLVLRSLRRRRLCLVLEAKLDREYGISDQRDSVAIYILARLLPLSMHRLTPAALLYKLRLPCMPASVLFLSHNNLVNGLGSITANRDLADMLMAHGALFPLTLMKEIPHGPKTLLSCYGDLIRYHPGFDPLRMYPQLMYRRCTVHNPWVMPYQEVKVSRVIRRAVYPQLVLTRNSFRRLFGRRNRGIEEDNLWGPFLLSLVRDAVACTLEGGLQNRILGLPARNMVVEEYTYWGVNYPMHQPAQVNYRDLARLKEGLQQGFDKLSARMKRGIRRITFGGFHYPPQSVPDLVGYVVGWIYY